jgi:hypothetical protein
MEGAAGPERVEFGGPDRPTAAGEDVVARLQAAWRAKATTESAVELLPTLLVTAYTEVAGRRRRFERFQPASAGPFGSEQRCGGYR